MLSVKSISKIMLALYIITAISGCSKDQTKTASAPSEVTQGEPVSKEIGIDIAAELSPTIMGVKNGVLSELPDSLTVGQALDGWKECSNPQWEEKTGDRGEKMVSFKCELKNKDETIALDQADSQKVKNVKYAILFSLSADSTSFRPTSSAQIFTFTDGKVYVEDYGSKWVMYDLKDIYRNNTLSSFHPKLTSDDYSARQ